jgi:hypothetical protein
MFLYVDNFFDILKKRYQYCELEHITAAGIGGGGGHTPRTTQNTNNLK